MIRILLAEDDAPIVCALTGFLEGEGFACTACAREDAAKAAIASQPFDLALVDVSLARGSGFAVCEAAKAKDIPVIFLTASGDENSVVKGLDMGADDYITKPFRPRELVSRIKSVLRRRTGADAEIRLANGAVVDPERGTVLRDGTDVRLSALEYRLLTVFLNNRGKLLTRSKLLEDIWDIAGDFVNDNTLTVYIKRLREKLGDDQKDPSVIKTVRGLGYRMD